MHSRIVKPVHRMKLSLEIYILAFLYYILIKEPLKTGSLIECSLITTDYYLREA
jgi:hypothetical protein